MLIDVVDGGEDEREEESWLAVDCSRDPLPML
jgi:hypothetical protein